MSVSDEAVTPASAPPPVGDSGVDGDASAVVNPVCVSDASHCEDGVCVSCQDAIKNNGEGDVDCGGTCAQKCNSSQSCNEGDDCHQGVCEDGRCAAPTCTDGVKNAYETDVDCGGIVCAANCMAGQFCKVKADCAGALNCVNGICKP